MPITFTGQYHYYLPRHVQRLIDVSNGPELVPNGSDLVFFPSPSRLQQLKIDHAPRPYRVFEFEGGLVLPEFFSLDGKIWKSTYYDQIMEKVNGHPRIKNFFLQGDRRQYILNPDGTFTIDPPFAQDRPIQIVFEDQIMIFDYVYPHLKYFVGAATSNTGAFGQVYGVPTPTRNKEVGIGWRTKINVELDFTINLIVAANESGISFRSYASNPNTGQFYQLITKFDSQRNCLIVDRKVRV